MDRCHQVDLPAGQAAKRIGEIDLLKEGGWLTEGHQKVDITVRSICALNGAAEDKGLGHAKIPKDREERLRNDSRDLCDRFSLRCGT